MEPSFDKKGCPPFRPTLDGCVGRDPRMAKLLEGCYRNELYAVSAYTYRSLMCEPIDREVADLFDAIAVEESEHFRLIGQLIVALGGNPEISAQLRVHTESLAREDSAQGARGVRQMLLRSVREEKASIERYQTLMGSTQDRVVRSLLAHILSNEQYHIDQLQRALP